MEYASFLQRNDANRSRLVKIYEHQTQADMARQGLGGSAIPRAQSRYRCGNGEMIFLRAIECGTDALLERERRDFRRDS
jgi:hypothetical protein